MHITNIFRRVRKTSPKQLVVAAAFTVALVSAVSLGLATKQKTSAAVQRDCSANSVNFKNLNGGCGAANAAELVADMRNNNPADLQATYSHFGLAPSEYNRFASTARQGVAYTDGRVVVDGQVVMDNAWSIGRTGFHYSQPYQIGGTRFHKSAHTDVLNSNLPVMVMFNANGEVEAAVLNACGNPVDGNKKKNSAACNALNMSEVKDKLNTFRFNTTAVVTGNASIQKVVYTFNDGGKTTQVTKTNPAEFVEKTFTANGTATVEVYVNLPGGQTKVVTSANCKKQVTVKLPQYACVVVIPRALNEEKTQFRFTVKATASNGATLKDIDFTLDGANTTTGVTTKDEQGNIYKDYTFEKDGKTHKIVAKVNFNLASGVQSKTCEATVTSGKAPVCEKNPQYPPDAPECNPECKPGVPVGSPECTPPQVLTSATELPVTGMGSVLGIFAGASIAGAAAHRVVTSRRRRF